MKTNVYIDAGNLYFGLLRKRPEYKWLDLVAFAETLLPAGNYLSGVKYFTSNIKTFPHDQAAIEHQNLYLQALAARGGVQIFFGKYNKNKTWLPVLDERCLTCDAVDDRKLIHVMKFEEKRTDVNLATEMLRDAYTTDVRSFALVSGDSDFTAPLDLIRKDLNKQVLVFNPKDRPTDLQNHAAVCIDIPRDLPARCQLPDSIPVGTHGNFIRRPAAWK